MSDLVDEVARTIRMRLDVFGYGGIVNTAMDDAAKAATRVVLEVVAKRMCKRCYHADPMDGPDWHNTVIAIGGNIPGSDCEAANIHRMIEELGA